MQVSPKRIIIAFRKKLCTMDHCVGLKQSPAQLPSPTPQSRGDTENVSLSTSEINGSQINSIPPFKSNSSLIPHKLLHEI